MEGAEIDNEEPIHSDCPFGKTDCGYPGDCGRYIDLNEDDVCDYSG